MQLSNDKTLLDKLGIWASSLCALHCLMLPVLIPLLPFVGATFFAEGWFERSILSISMIIGSWALLSGFYRYHRQLYPLFSLALGGLIYWNKGMLGAVYEPYTITLGALLIVGAHVANIKLSRGCQRCDSPCSSAEN